MASPAAITEKPMVPAIPDTDQVRPQDQRKPKATAYERIAQLEATIEKIRKGAGIESPKPSKLQSEIRALIEQREQLQVEVVTAGRVVELQTKVVLLQTDLAGERALREGLQIQIEQLQQSANERLQSLRQQCSEYRAHNPQAWDVVMSKLADIPLEWTRIIAELPDEIRVEFLLFLASTDQLVKYLRELRPDAAVKRLRRAAFDFERDETKRSGEHSA